MPFRYELQQSDLSAIQAIVENLSGRFPSVDDPEFLDTVTLYAQELPRPLRKLLNDFRLADEKSDYALISGFPVDDSKIGPTPPHWDNRPPVSPTLEAEIYLMMLADLLGDPFAWSTQQGGYICHDLLPVKGLEMEQTGSSSECILDFHTEDAFHPLRGDYVALMCLRNPGNTATTVGTLDLDSLSEDEIAILFEPRFTFKPDLTHTEAFSGRRDFWNSGGTQDISTAYEKINMAENEPPKVPILSGRPDAPFICIDPVFMDRPKDNHAAAAFEALVQSLNNSLRDVVLTPGDVVFVDNFRMVHGRQPFQANYDGTDRWLKRINLTTDFRKSFPARIGESSRLVF